MMTARQVANLAMKVLAVWTLVQAVQSLPYLGYGYTSIHSGVSSGLIVSGLVSGGVQMALPVLMGIVALIIWKRAGVIAAVIVGHDLQDEPDEPDSSPKSASVGAVHAVVLSTLGAWVLVDSIPDVFRYLSEFITWVASGSTNPNRNWLLEFYDLRLIGMIVRLAVGSWLFLGSNGSVHYLRRVRRIGLEPGEEPNPGSSGSNTAG
jgi:hypothetical protein